MARWAFGSRSSITLADAACITVIVYDPTARDGEGILYLAALPRAIFDFNNAPEERDCWWGRRIYANFSAEYEFFRRSIEFLSEFRRVAKCHFFFFTSNWRVPVSVKSTYTLTARQKPDFGSLRQRVTLALVVRYARIAFTIRNFARTSQLTFYPVCPRALAFRPNAPARNIAHIASGCGLFAQPLDELLSFSLPFSSLSFFFGRSQRSAKTRRSWRFRAAKIN